MLADGATMGATASVGVFDVLLLGGVGAAIIYWVFLRKKKDDTVPEIKRLTVVPTLQRCDSQAASFMTKMKNAGRNIIIFYGSQTGTAEEFASRLAKDAARYGMKGMIADPEDCEMEDISKLNEIDNSIAIFCMATYGEGDPTDNAMEFHEFLQEGSTELNGLNYTVFALGNKTYEHYNKMGKDVDKMLEKLGGERLYQLGFGDDDGNIEEDFLNWKEGFWPAVCEKFGIDGTGQDVNLRQYALEDVSDKSPEKIFVGEPARLRSMMHQRPPYDSKNPYMAPVTVNRELFSGGNRSCMHLELDISESKLRYDAGDHVVIYPTNESEIVEKIGERLSKDLGEVFSLNNVDEDASKRHPFPCPTTYRTALLHYLDITSPVRQNLLKEMIEYASGEDKEFLTKITSNTTEAKELYSEWVLKDQRCILDVLQDLSTLSPPIDHLCEFLTRLQPRYYSISSSPKVHPKSIHVTAILVDYETRLSRHRNGVATFWLKSKIPTGDMLPRVPIFVRKSQFRLPFKSSVPIIMIGPGTGVAPFRGFIQERDFTKQEGKPVGATVLYYGCRNEDVDFLYKDELNGYVEKGSLTKLHSAFSRQQKEKVYVQHMLAKNKDEIWKILDEGGHLYVCGDAKNMANDVDKVLQDIIHEKGDMDMTKAQEYLKKLRARGRYSCDVWS